MGWREVAQEQRGAAQTLASPQRSLPRASASRSYYAVYSLIAANSPSDVKFPNGWGNPHHDQLPEIIKRIGGRNRADITELTASLRQDRIDADYRPDVAFGMSRAREALRRCQEVFDKLK